LEVPVLPVPVPVRKKSEESVPVISSTTIRLVLYVGGGGPSFYIMFYILLFNIYSLTHKTLA